MWKIRHIELFVADTAKSLGFYRDILGCEVTAIQDAGRFVWLRMGSVELLLRPGMPANAPETYQSAAVGIVLYTKSLAAAQIELRARGLEFDGDDGPACPTFRDPDGHWFQLVEQE